MKKRRGRNGLTRAEFLQQEAQAEIAKRVDEILDNIAKKKAKVDEEEGES